MWRLVLEDSSVAKTPAYEVLLPVEWWCRNSVLGEWQQTHSKQHPNSFAGSKCGMIVEALTELWIHSPISNMISSSYRSICEYCGILWWWSEARCLQPLWQRRRPVGNEALHFPRCLKRCGRVNWWPCLTNRTPMYLLTLVHWANTSKIWHGTVRYDVYFYLKWFFSPEMNCRHEDLRIDFSCYSMRPLTKIIVVREGSFDMSIAMSLTSQSPAKWTQGFGEANIKCTSPLCEDQ